MFYPYVSELPTNKQHINVFRGYNHNLRISDEELYDMKNLSSTNFPVLSQREQRGTFFRSGSVSGLIDKEELCYCDGTCFVNVDGQRIDMGLSDSVKTMVSMGAYVIILPDKKYINTVNSEDRGDIESSFKPTGKVKFTICKQDGSDYENLTVAEYEPSDPTNADYWLDTSSVPNVLKQYSTSSAVWISVPSVYIRIESEDIGKAFEQYDGVKISGIKNEKLKDLNNTMSIYAKDDNYIVVIGITDEVIEESGDEISVSREMPVMDFIIESGNRLWGCRYGTAANGETVNEIYASKLGDFKNWNAFMGISTDSYAATVGSDGKFTAAVTHLGYPLFFKENYIHKVYGNYPATYQIQTTAARGVASGSERSLATVNEILYYKSRNGVCAYDGSLPIEISSAFGEKTYKNAVGGYVGNKYYVSMESVSEGEYVLFVYDTTKGMWHREDCTQAVLFCNCKGELYYIDKYHDIRTVCGQGERDTDPIEWMAETGIFGMEFDGRKYLSRLLIKMSLEIGARAVIKIEYNSSGDYEVVYTARGHSIDSFSVPIKPKRCDHFRLRIEGEGKCNVYSIVKTITEGSER